MFPKGIDRPEKKKIQVSKVLPFQNLSKLPSIPEQIMGNRLIVGLSGDFGGKKGDTTGVLDGGCLLTPFFKRLCCPYKFLQTVQMKPDHKLDI